MGQRITVIGGPWPERIGCRGRIVTDELDPSCYPVRGRGPDEVVILLYADPLADEDGHASDAARGWTCAMRREHVEVEP